MVSTYYIADPIHALCRLAHVPLAEVAQAAGLSAAAIEDKGRGISAAETFALWTALRTLSDDPDLPINLARQAARVQIVPTLLAYSLSPTVDTGLQQLAVFKKATGPFLMEVCHLGSELKVTVQSSETDLALPRYLGLFEAAYLVELVRLSTASHVIPTQVQIPESQPNAADFFGIAPLHGPAVAVSLKADDASLPLVSTNDTLLNQLQPTFEKAVKRHQPAPPIAEIVALHIRENATLSQVSLSSVARSLGLSQRALQRLLKAQDTSFQAVLRNTRLHMAMMLLIQGDDTVATIAVKLGYQDANSFYRAFQRWTGLTPNQVHGSQTDAPS